jgi:hypothetical protein
MRITAFIERERNERDYVDKMSSDRITKKHFKLSTERKRPLKEWKDSVQ